ncbi:PO113 protein, partial [Steatornis caripensis]|nr:PO113 protein [Steatornis caripensis]
PGRKPGRLIIPIEGDYVSWCMANSLPFQLALEGFEGQVSYHLPSHKSLQTYSELKVIQKPLAVDSPVQGPTVFTDGSGKLGKAVVTWYDRKQWQELVNLVKGSPQLVELSAVIVAFKIFLHCAVSIVTDSAYVADVAQHVDRALLKEVNSEQLFSLLKMLWTVVSQHMLTYYILHIRSHTGLPGFIYEGNARANALAAPTRTPPVPDLVHQAFLSHHFFHQGARALVHQFKIPFADAKSIYRRLSRVSMTRTQTG